MLQQYVKTHLVNAHEQNLAPGAHQGKQTVLNKSSWNDKWAACVSFFEKSAHGRAVGSKTLLKRAGFRVVEPADSHLCCGSAGTYSVLQADTAYALRDRKLGHLNHLQPTAILSANIGCITHLQSGADVPVRHWVELVDEVLSKSH